MKNTFVIILTLIGFLAFGQEHNLDRIENEVKSIESDSTLQKMEFDWVELTGITTDGGGILKVWRNEKQIRKIVEEIGLSYGRIRTIIYLNNGNPIKIIETEENFGRKNDELNYEELSEVYREIIYVFDWENDNAEIKRTGKRNMSEGSCSMYELAESVMERAEKAIKE
ncbi:hypothetical protein P8625_00310 [Tenacibaculum tangerinum]|uniref:DUF4468 domain-containing protein n=1 Tax=Tenacibaculum tangerinum TaxID=3038772 RepID=A0ABY8L2I0_9FLAO|nr:hypothetical protein [Tenacibaculum tangerinum]WGH75639.1 hypothetical protein P8625_00310 [Tenacibaculum tangerinum]